MIGHFLAVWRRTVVTGIERLACKESVCQNCGGCNADGEARLNRRTTVCDFQNPSRFVSRRTSGQATTGEARAKILGQRHLTLEASPEQLLVSIQTKGNLDKKPKKHYSESLSTRFLSPRCARARVATDTNVRTLGSCRDSRTDARKSSVIATFSSSLN